MKMFFCGSNTWRSFDDEASESTNESAVRFSAVWVAGSINNLEMFKPTKPCKGYMFSNMASGLYKAVDDISRTNLPWLLVR